MRFVVDLMRRFMPDADQSTLIMAAIWLVGQCTVFIRHREQLAMPPVSLDLDEPGVELASGPDGAKRLSARTQSLFHGLGARRRVCLRRTGSAPD